MKITVRYSERSYGTGEYTSNYRAHINKSQHSISIGFYFNDVIFGRGWGDNIGVVQGASVELSLTDTRKLSLALLNLIETPGDAIKALYFGRADTTPVESFKQKIKSTYEPADKFVLSTFDGRTLQHGFLGIVPDPGHYNEASGKFRTDSWNKKHPKYDHVSLTPWREHYARMIDLLDQPAGA